MSIFLDQKYAVMLPLEGFEKKYNGDYFANFRCPICNDSKNTNKKRGWLYNDGDKLTYHCFNCGYSNTFFGFLKDNYGGYFDDYIKELYFDKYKNQNQHNHSEKEKDLFKNKQEDLDLIKIRDLPTNHVAVKYIEHRKIPMELVLDCYYSDNFYEWCKTKQPDTFNNEVKCDRRLIFPFKNRKGEIFGLSGRTLDNATPKYITVKLDGDYPKIFGLDKLNIHKRVYVTEGQIDSLYIDNCIGAIGALGSIDTICEFATLHNKKNVVLVIDNEKRNRETCNFIKKNLQKGYSVSLWSNDIKEKDINEMIMNGKTKEDILETIDANVVNGTIGLLKLANWRKR